MIFIRDFTCKPRLLHLKVHTTGILKSQFKENFSYLSYRPKNKYLKIARVEKFKKMFSWKSGANFIANLYTKKSKLLSINENNIFMC